MEITALVLSVILLSGAVCVDDYSSCPWWRRLLGVSSKFPSVGRRHCSDVKVAGATASQSSDALLTANNLVELIDGATVDVIDESTLAYEIDGGTTGNIVGETTTRGKDGGDAGDMSSLSVKQATKTVISSTPRLISDGELKLLDPYINFQLSFEDEKSSREKYIRSFF